MRTKAIDIISFCTDFLVQTFFLALLPSAIAYVYYFDEIINPFLFFILAACPVGLIVMKYKYTYAIENNLLLIRNYYGQNITTIPFEKIEQIDIVKKYSTEQHNLIVNISFLNDKDEVTNLNWKFCAMEHKLQKFITFIQEKHKHINLSVSDYVFK